MKGKKLRGITKLVRIRREVHTTLKTLAAEEQYLMADITEKMLEFALENKDKWLSSLSPKAHFSSVQKEAQSSKGSKK